MFAAEKEVADGHVDFEQLARLPRDQVPRLAKASHLLLTKRSAL
jgi:hypothetical protein